MKAWIKEIIWRIAVWVEDRAYDVRYWAHDLHEYERTDMNDLVVGAINRDPSPFWNNMVENNALAKRLNDASSR